MNRDTRNLIFVLTLALAALCAAKGRAGCSFPETVNSPATLPVAPAPCFRGNAGSAAPRGSTGGQQRDQPAFLRKW